MMDYWLLNRWNTILVVILQHLQWSLTMDGQQPITGVYCVRETFAPECEEGEVLTLQRARYGRMQLGKCIASDLGLSQYMGCSTDVLHLADSMCSGRRRCSLRLPDPSFEATNPCNTLDLSNYLEASYSCLPVVTFAQAECSDADEMRIASPPTGYLSSLTTDETGCGSTDHPWRITASPGQRITITLIDFDSNEGGAAETGTCTIYAVIKEPSVQTTKTVCGGQDKEHVVYQTMGDTVEIQVRANSGRHFLFHYQFTGCTDPAPVAKLTFTRNGNQGRWRCEESDVEWTVRCDGSRWIGDERDCTLQPLTAATARPTKQAVQDGFPAPVSSFSWKMVLILVAIVTVGMVACVLIIAIVCLKRSRASAGAQPVTQYPLYEVYDLPAPRRVSERDVPQAYYQSLPKDYHSKKTYTDNTLAPDGRYDKPVWERPLPRPPGKGDFDA